MAWRRGGLGVACVGLCAAGAVAQDDGSAREWNQPRGNAARSAWVDVAPMLAQPAIAWRREMPGPLVSSPVTWQGVVYVAARSPKGELSLTAVQGATGDVLATRSLGKGEWADLAVLSGTVFAVQADAVKSYKFDGKSLSLGWTVSANRPSQKSVWSGQPAISGRVVIVPAADSIRLLDPSSGRDVIPPLEFPGTLEYPGYPAVAVKARGAAGDVVARPLRVDGLLAYNVSGLGTRAPTARPDTVLKWLFSPRELPLRRERGWCVLAPLGNAWFANSDLGFIAQGDGSLSLAVIRGADGKSYGCPIENPAAIIATTAYGMSREGSLFSVEPDARYRQLTERSSRPAGTRTGSASAARGVLYLPNWALDISSGRVLWCLPDLDPVTPLIPTDDGRAVCADASGCLIGLADPTAASAAPATGAPAVATLAMPGDVDGVLLPDGRFVEGRVAVTAEGRVLVAPVAGETLLLAPGAFALAQTAATRVAVDEERVVLRAWHEILDSRSAAQWEAVVRSFANAQLVSDALAALAAAKRDGLSDQRARDLEKLIAGKRDHPNAELQRKRVSVDTRALRDAHLADVRAAALWCAERGQSGAAAALLARVRSERPDDPSCEETARALLPPGLPFAKMPDAGRRWIEWATQIVPAGGEFVPPQSHEMRTRRPAPWDNEVVILRSRNVLLVSRSSDAAIVGRCLRHAEGAIRACQSVLGPASPSAPEGRMEVRLHRDRAAYTAESAAAGSRIGEWTAGYYSPDERVSRFYVPGADETAATPLELGLLRVLAHEVTHQWIDLRWEPGGRSNMQTPGYWCVEGTARFIEEQSVEMGRRDERLDDATVSALDIASQIDAKHGLTDMDDFLAITHQSFESLGSAPVTEIRMRNTARIAGVTPRSLFYEQAGSLVFWLVTKRGDAGRAAFAEYLRQRYRGAFSAPAAKLLGFPSADEMELQFRAFLAELRR